MEGLGELQARAVERANCVLARLPLYLMLRAHIVPHIVSHVVPYVSGQPFVHPLAASLTLNVRPL